MRKLFTLTGILLAALLLSACRPGTYYFYPSGSKTPVAQQVGSTNAQAQVVAPPPARHMPDLIIPS